MDQGNKLFRIKNILFKIQVTRVNRFKVCLQQGGLGCPNPSSGPCPEVTYLGYSRDYDKWLGLKKLLAQGLAKSCLARTCLTRAGHLRQIGPCGRASEQGGRELSRSVSA